MSSSPAVLKQQAAALELKKQPEKALALYQQLLAEHGGSEDVDVALRNRVGDLHLRVGQIDEAIDLFERSADEYALSGFLNNAIALCNKILRQRPGHVPTLRRLARFSAEKGMTVDAQRHYLSVAETLEELGQHGEALKALSEFAELSPEDVHVRSVVAEQLLRAGRKPDALPHLTVLHRLHVAAGRTEEAEGVAQVAREIDESWVPEAEQSRGANRTDLSLFLIDSDDDFGMLETSPTPGSSLERPSSVTSLDGLESSGPAAVEVADLPGSQPLEGFEATSLDPEPEQAGSAPAPEEPQGPSASIGGDELLDLGADASAGSVDFLAASELTELDLDAPFDALDGPMATPSVELLDDFMPSFDPVDAGTPASLPVSATGVDDWLFDADVTESVDSVLPTAAREPDPPAPVEVRAADPAVEAPFRPKRPIFSTSCRSFATVSRRRSRPTTRRAISTSALPSGKWACWTMPSPNSRSPAGVVSSGWSRLRRSAAVSWTRGSRPSPQASCGVRWTSRWWRRTTIFSGAFCTCSAGQVRPSGHGKTGFAIIKGCTPWTSASVMWRPVSRPCSSLLR